MLANLQYASNLSAFGLDYSGGKSDGGVRIAVCNHKQQQQHERVACTDNEKAASLHSRMVRRRCQTRPLASCEHGSARCQTPCRAFSGTLLLFLAVAESTDASSTFSFLIINCHAKFVLPKSSCDHLLVAILMQMNNRVAQYSDLILRSFAYASLQSFFFCSSYFQRQSRRPDNCVDSKLFSLANNIFVRSFQSETEHF